MKALLCLMMLFAPCILLAQSPDWRAVLDGPVNLSFSTAGSAVEDEGVKMEGSSSLRLEGSGELRLSATGPGLVTFRWKTTIDQRVN